MRSTFPTENYKNTIGFCKNPSEFTFPIVEKFYIQEFNSYKYFFQHDIKIYVGC